MIQEKSSTGWASIMAIGTVLAMIIFGFFVVAVVRDSKMMDIPANRDRRQAQLHDLELSRQRVELEAQATRQAMEITMSLNAAARDEEAARQRAEKFAAFGAYFQAAADGIRWLIVPLAMFLVGTLVWQRRKPLFNSDIMSSAATGFGRVIVDVERSRAFGVANKSPDSLVYSPHNRYQNHQEGGGQLAAPLPAVASLDDFIVESDGSPLIMLGIDDEGNKVEAPMSAWVGIGLYGQSGFGKTTTIRAIATQFAVRGGGIVVFDPHHHARRDTLHRVLAPLEPRYYLPPALDDDSIINNCAKLMHELDARMRGRGSAAHIFVAIDEYTSMVRRGGRAGEALYNLAISLAQEGRKVGMSVLTASQVSTAKSSGGSEQRDSMPTIVAHRLPRNQAQNIFPSEFANDVANLGRGEVVASLPTGDFVHLRVPNTDDRAVAIAARNSLFSLPALPKPASDENSENAKNREKIAFSENENERKVREFFELGETRKSIIVPQVWGVRAGGGRAYQEAVSQYDAIVRRMNDQV